MDTYFRPHLLKVAVDAVRRQTYENIELILVNNGGTAETVDYLHELETQDKRVKLVHFKENQYKPFEPGLIIQVCYNAGLSAATGDYVFHQSDDDVIADDYVEKMVALFGGNRARTNAAGLARRIHPDGPRIPQVRSPH